MLTPEQCLYIRKLRCGKLMHSWRRISELFCEKFNTDWDLHGVQMHGSDLCKKAAKFFNEDSNNEPW